MHDARVGRVITFVLLVVAVVAAIYAWQHRSAIENPQVPAPGPVVVTVNP
jgi:hypothetical protein